MDPEKRRRLREAVARASGPRKGKLPEAEEFGPEWGGPYQGPEREESK